LPGSAGESGTRWLNEATDLVLLMEAQRWLDDLPPGHSLSEAGAELGSQLSPERLDLAVDPCQLGAGLPFFNVTVAAGCPGEGLDLSPNSWRAVLSLSVEPLRCHSSF
jgi:hypothetical protein